jgi:hypothetical protein
MQIGRIVKIGTFPHEVIGFHDGNLLLYCIRLEKVYQVGYTGKVAYQGTFKAEIDGQLEMSF